MFFGDGEQRYGDDYFDNTRMSFGDHLEELRMHLWRAVAGFCVAMVFCFFISKSVLTGFIVSPVEGQLGEFWERRHESLRQAAMEEHNANPQKSETPQFFHVAFARAQLTALVQGQPVLPVDTPEDLADDDWVQLVQRISPIEIANKVSPALLKLGPKPLLRTMNVTEAFMVYFKVSLACGFVVASPWVFWQVWMFVAAGLYPSEKRIVHLYLPFSVALFLSGACVCQFVVLPKAVGALLWFNEWLGFDPDLRLNEWLGFALMMPIVFGLAFQTPLVMLLMYKIGIVDIDSFRNKRAIAFFTLAVFSALITPSIDAVSMLFLWGPLCLLYEMGILLCAWSPRPQFDLDEGDGDGGLVEV